MKFKKIALAAACLAVCGSSFALDKAGTQAAQIQFYVSGSSALQAVFTNAIVNNTTPSTYNIYKGRNTSGASSATDNADGQSYTIYSGTISTNAFGPTNNGKTLAVYLRSAGGSGFGVFPVAAGTAIAFGDASTIGATTATTFDGVVNHKPDAGLSDLEPVAFNDPVNHPIDPTSGADLFPGAKVSTSSFASSSIVAAQTFGLLVNSKLYADLQADQSTSGVPTVSSSAFATIYAPGYSSNAPAPSDWTPFFNNGGGHPTNQVNICSRLPGSGTRASAQALFVQLPYSSLSQSFASPGTDNTGDPSTIDQNNAGTYVIGEYDNTAAVIGCVTTATANNGYAIGIASTDRDLSTSDAKFVLLDNQTPNASASKFGKYPWFYEAYYQVSKTAAAGAFATAFGTEFKSPANINLLSAASKNGILAAVANCPASPYTSSPATLICSHVTRNGDYRAFIQYAK